MVLSAHRAGSGRDCSTLGQARASSELAPVVSASLTEYKVRAARSRADLCLLRMSLELNIPFLVLSRPNVCVRCGYMYVALP